MILLDKLLLSPVHGVVWAARQIHHALEQERAAEPARITAELSELYMLLETGRITAAEFDAREKVLLDQLEQLEEAEGTGRDRPNDVPPHVPPPEGRPESEDLAEEGATPGSERPHPSRWPRSAEVGCPVERLGRRPGAFAVGALGEPPAPARREGTVNRGRRPGFNQTVNARNDTRVCLPPVDP